MRRTTLGSVGAVAMFFLGPQIGLAKPSPLPRTYNKANVLWTDVGPLPVGVTTNCASEAGGGSMTINCGVDEVKKCYASIKLMDGSVENWRNDCNGTPVLEDLGTTIVGHGIVWGV